MYHCTQPQSKALSEREGDESDFLASDASDCECGDAVADENGLDVECNCGKGCDGPACCFRAALRSAAFDEKTVRREDAQQQTLTRGKHGKLKKLKSKYRNQDESERQVVLQVR
jgi:hypothetical protein